jgi:hypothetical protein
MSKFYIFATICLFWTVLAVSLMQVQLAASPMHKMRVPTFRSMPIRGMMVAQVSTLAAATFYN